MKRRVALYARAAVGGQFSPSTISAKSNGCVSSPRSAAGRSCPIMSTVMKE